VWRMCEARQMCGLHVIPCEQNRNISGGECLAHDRCCLPWNVINLQCEEFAAH
jgi:hypothetical protein